MRGALLTLAATCAMLVGGLTWTDTAEARPWRGYYRAPAVRYYRPYYYGYRPYYRYYYGPRYYYGYPRYYGYRTYYGPGIYFRF